MAERRIERTLQPPRLSGVFPKAAPGSRELPGTVADRSGRFHPFGVSGHTLTSPMPVRPVAPVGSFVSCQLLSP